MTMASVTWPNDENVCRSASVSVPLRSCNASLCEYVVPCERKVRVFAASGGATTACDGAGTQAATCVPAEPSPATRADSPRSREGARRKGLTRTGFQRRS